MSRYTPPPVDTSHTGTSADMAIGASAVAGIPEGVAIGPGASANAYSFALGGGAATDANGSAAIGNSAFAHYFGVAIGNSARALADQSIAVGASAQVPSDSAKSTAIGVALVAPAATPDTCTIKNNDLRLVRSTGTGATRIRLTSPNGTGWWLSIDNTGTMQITQDV